MITLKTEPELAVMREAGLVVARCLELLRTSVEPGMTTMDLDQLAESFIRGEGAAPSFKGYNGFPATLCLSINDEIVHGIPSAARVIRDGDVVSIDCGAVVGGFHGDAAVTVPVGTVGQDVLDLLRVCEESLWRGFAAARLGGRLRDISAAVEAHIRPHGYGIVEGYGGHGIGQRLHEDPHVLNYVEPRSGRGAKLVKGLVLAVEPMVNLGRPDTRELDDGWTVVTADGSVSAHFEHTFTLTEEGPWVLTAEDGGASMLAPLLADGSVR